MESDQRIQDIINKFSKMDSWEDRYKSIIQDGKKGESLDRELQIDKFKVNGCQSQVWLVPSLKNGKVFFRSDSDSFLVKGIAHLLVSVYSNLIPEDILGTGPEFLKEIGITEHLSMNRSNGLSSMVKQIHMYAIAYKSLTDKGILNVS